MGTEIDQQIPATDQVQVGKRRVLDDVLFGEYAHFPDGFVNLISAVVAHEETAQPLLGNSRNFIRRVDAAARPVKGKIADIRGEDLDGHLRNRGSLAPLIIGPQKFEENHGQGINLLPSGAAGNPNPQRAVLGFPVLQETGKDFVAQSLECSFVAKKLGDVNQKVAVQGVEFGGVAVDVAEIILQLQEMVQDHAPLDASLQGGLLVVPEIHSHGFLQQGEKNIQILGRVPVTSGSRDSAGILWPQSRG